MGARIVIRHRLGNSECRVQGRCSFRAVVAIRASVAIRDSVATRDNVVASTVFQFVEEPA